ncbi:MAG TPA: N-acetylornithine carbamoyltransferase [Gammaproteobacteria bacterium]|jgi:N-acetylornithine carbamoyltransferase|nr:N-acetylornithine carbamoyltransferase [Gammaproteobacteria bacterium]
MRRFNDLADFSNEEIKDLIALANRLDRNPEPRALEGKVLSLLFLSPSLRTLSSFQAAMIRLGGGAFVISPDMSIHGLESRYGIVMDGAAAEHVREAIPVIASYGDAMGVRAFAQRNNLAHDLAETDFKNLTSLIDKPWINMESANDHPCQSLADWKTLDDLGIPENAKFVLSWGYHPKPLPLAVSAATIHMAAKRGMNVVHLRPPGFELPPQIMDKARKAAAASGGSVTETTDRREAMEGAHVIYTKSYSSTKYYGDKLGDQALREQLVGTWCVDEPWFANARPDCRFMHCLPVRRGVEVSDRILDGSRSVVIQEARNRLYAQMAVLYRMMKG